MVTTFFLFLVCHHTIKDENKVFLTSKEIFQTFCSKVYIYIFVWQIYI